MSGPKEPEQTERYIYADHPAYSEFPDQTQFSRRVKREMKKERGAMVGGLTDTQDDAHD